MDGVTLLREARRAGLQVRAEGGRLIVRGPRSQEALARQLLAHKAEVLQHLECSSAKKQPSQPNEPNRPQKRETTRWDEPEANRLLKDTLARVAAANPDTTKNPTLWLELEEEIDAAYLAQDMTRLKAACAEYENLGTWVRKDDES